MKQVQFEILENKPLTATVWKMTMQGDVEGIRPGQFVDIRVPELFLRRPISVADIQFPLALIIIYKVVGEGTDKMSRMLPGQTLDVLTGLGNGYDLSKAGNRPLLVGGGVGVPPLLYAASLLSQSVILSPSGEKQKRRITVVLGFNTKEEVFLEEEFRALGCEVIVCTADGSYGRKGFVTDAIAEYETRAIAERSAISSPLGEQPFSYFYACGPLPMLRALEKTVTIDGEMSYEERMGCGFGVCVGCSIRTVDGYRKVCHDGPVFPKGKVVGSR